MGKVKVVVGSVIGVVMAYQFPMGKVKFADNPNVDYKGFLYQFPMGKVKIPH